MTEEHYARLKVIESKLFGCIDPLHTDHLINYARQSLKDAPYDAVRSNVKETMGKDAELLRDALIPFIKVPQPNATYSFIKIL